MNKKMTLLLVEDNEKDEKLIKEMLATGRDGQHFDIISVDTLSNAIDVLSRSEIDLILLDLNLPDSQGFETYHSISKLKNDAPIIVLIEVDNYSWLTENEDSRLDYLVKKELNSGMIQRTISSALKKAELANSVAVYEYMVENSDRAIYGCDMTGKITRWNKGASKIYGYTPDRIIGDSISSLFAVDEREQAELLLKNIANGMKEFRFETKHVTDSGKEIDVLMVISCVINEYGKPSAVNFIVVDLTDQKNNEKLLAIQYRVATVLHESDDIHQSFSTIIKTICEILTYDAGEVWLVDDARSVLSIASSWSRNDSQGEFSSASEGVTLHINEGVPGRVWLSRNVCWIKNIGDKFSTHRTVLLMQSGLNSELGYPLLFRGNVLGVIIFYAAKISKPSDAFNAMFKVICDLIGSSVVRSKVEEHRTLLHSQLYTKNKELENQMAFLNQANHAKSTFIANMSHELRTPLNTIIGFSELIYKGKLGAILPAQYESIEQVVKSSRHLLNLVNQILDISRIESGRMKCDLLPTNISQLVQDVCHSMKLEAESKRIPILYHPDRVKIESVLTDQDKLRQILINFISNAIKFTPSGGKITVEVSQQGDGFFRVSVSDTGIGISKDDLDKLFIEFGQLSISYSKTQQGIGLGLALSKHMAELLGGSVGVVSAVGSGSTFYVDLPMTKDSSAAVEPGSETLGRELG